MPTFGDSAAFTPQHPMRASYNPTAEEPAKAKALINFLMQDRLFLALYRSNDPNVRAVAMDKLNKAHIQAYGISPAKDGDAGAVAGWK